jgi:hypothetical protein
MNEATVAGGGSTDQSLRDDLLLSLQSKLKPFGSGIKPGIRPPGIWQNEANCKAEQSAASLRHRTPQAARSRTVARTGTPHPPI